MTTLAEDDAAVRVAVYESFLQRGRAPAPAEIGDALGRAQADVENALRRLADVHLLVLAPGTPYVWMANPFSALPTAYRVTAADREWFGNCIWDAMGILAIVGSDGVVDTRCPDCGDTLRVEVVDGEVVPLEALVHYAIPAAQWWDDIGFN